MKRRASFLMLFLLSIYAVLAQSSTINQFDKDGKKDGKWIIYLDKNWKHIDDSTKATFCRYTYFDHGVNIYPQGPAGKNGFRLEAPRSAKSGKFLEGEYKWYDSKGKLSSLHVFKDGEYVLCKEYFASGEVQQFFDYTKKCEGQEFGWFVTIYNKDGSIKFASKTCKDEKGQWPALRD